MRKIVECVAQEDSEAKDIKHFKIDFSDIDKANIKRAFEILNEDRFISNLRIDVDGDVIYIDSDGNRYYSGDDDDKFKWIADTELFIVYKDSIYYYAQSKWDILDYIESEEININEIIDLK